MIATPSRNPAQANAGFWLCLVLIRAKPENSPNWAGSQASVHCYKGIADHRKFKDAIGF